jgi:FtsH-binding integral membrane protein
MSPERVDHTASPMITNRWTLFCLALADAVFFLVTNLTVRTRSDPGTVSNVFAYALLVGVVLLIVLAIVALVRWLRSARAGRG